MALRGLLVAFLTLIATMALALTAVSVFAHSEEDFNATKQLVDSGVSCSILSDDQLEEIGEYYMEQMHPGEAHELMDRMMGGEGSEGLRQTHIQMAKVLYCGESYNGMMGYGMMGSGYGMMGVSYGSLNVNSTLFTVVLIMLIVALVLLIALLYKKVRKR